MSEEEGESDRTRCSWPPRGETDWARVNAMTDEEVLAAACSDPDAQPLGPEELAKMRRVSSCSGGGAPTGSSEQEKKQ